MWGIEGNGIAMCGMTLAVLLGMSFEAEGTSSLVDDFNSEFESSSTMFSKGMAGPSMCFDRDKVALD